MKFLLIRNIFAAINLYAWNEAKSFTIDKSRGTFLKDGKPFQYVSGTLFYFRIPWQFWKDRMLKMRAAGLNVLDTYVEWRIHEPEPRKYDFTNNLDINKFIKMAQEIGFLVIIRPGPYIGAERDMGGLPYWLMKTDKDIELRLGNTRSGSAQTAFHSDKRCFAVKPDVQALLQGLFLLKKNTLYISLTIENQYGRHFACDTFYTAHLRYEFRKHLGEDTVLFTTDGPSETLLNCGSIEDVYATVSVTAGSDIKKAFAAQLNKVNQGPLVISDFYIGWMDFWGYPHARVSTENITKSLDEILAARANVNLYAFHGGTSFGFNSGSTIDKETFKSCTTSFDFDAPLTEAGDPTDKYFAIRNVIGKYFPVPNITLPTISPKMKFGPVKLSRLGSLIDIFLVNSKQESSSIPLSFEELGQAHGFVLYKAIITFQPADPAPLAIPSLQDRAYVYINNVFIGILSRGEKLLSIPVMAVPDQTLSILVEEQGRLFIGSEENDFKGISDGITIGGQAINNWTMYKIDVDQIAKSFNLSATTPTLYKSGEVPAYYGAEFQIPPNIQVLDTFLRVKKWGKGVAYLNGINLGRYWPLMGPQKTLYVPSVYFKPPPKTNILILLELERAPCSGIAAPCSIFFRPTHVLNAKTPHTEKNHFEYT